LLHLKDGLKRMVNKLEIPAAVQPTAAAASARGGLGNARQCESQEKPPLRSQNYDK
jgi:hypothetical protein